MKSSGSGIYDANYYLNECLGYEEFKKSNGKIVHPRIKYLVGLLDVEQNEKILDLGCGRGDLVVQVAKKGSVATGIDYSGSAMKIAHSLLKNQKKSIKKNVNFFKMNAKSLRFKNNSFDTVISVDVFEHLFKEELEIVMKEIKRVLKPNGKLIVVTGYNKVYLDYTHRFWSYPIDRVLVKLNSFITGKEYVSLNKDSRSDLHKKQHVNEPTYLYLKKIFQKYSFYGKIFSVVPVKPRLSWKDTLHNFLVSLHPFSTFFPLHLLFAHEYVCIMKNKKT